MTKSLTRETTGLSSNPMSVVGAIIKSLLYSFAFVIILTLLIYIGLSLDWIQIKTINPIFVYGNYLAVILGAAIAGVSLHGRGWLIGLVFACIYFIIASMLAPVWSLSGIVAPLFFTRLFITLGIGTLGGMIGVNL
jgi:putative membrane protein (TIGR04086 family)